LYVSRTTTYISGYFSPLGVFTSENISKGSDLCFKKGILINKALWNCSDFKNSNIREVNSKSSILLDQDTNYIRFTDYVKDPLDFSKVNAELVEVQFGNVVLRATKNSNAGKEIFIAFGLKFWAYLFRLTWNTNESMSEIQRKVKQVYSISDISTSSIYNEFRISKTIADKLNEFMYWELETVHSLINLSNTNNSCYMASIFECISHIPALSRLLLETDLCTNISNTTFLFNYIKLLKGSIHKNKQSKSYIDQISNFLKIIEM